MIKYKNRKKTRLLIELEPNPLVERACKKIGISRATFYRWCESDPVFKSDALGAQDRGRDKLTDFVESKLLENISTNQHAAIAFWLSHNTTRYRAYPTKLYIEDLDRFQKQKRVFDEVLVA